MRTAKWCELEVAKPHAFARDEWMHCEAHLSQDLLRSRRGSRGKEDGDGALEPGERRNVEVIVVLVAQNNTIDLGKVFETKYTWRVHAILEPDRAKPQERMRRAQRRRRRGGQTGEDFGRTDHPGATRHPSSVRRGIIKACLDREFETHLRSVRPSRAAVLRGETRCRRV